MCEVVKVYLLPTEQASLVATDEAEEIDINSIAGITTLQLSFKETNGELHNLTQEVFIFMCVEPNTYFSSCNFQAVINRPLIDIGIDLYAIVSLLFSHFHFFFNLLF